MKGLGHKRSHICSLVFQPTVIVVVALALRSAFIVLLHFYRFSHNPIFFSFGWEMGSVAKSLATGQGFSSPCAFTSGPTAMVPPVFPVFLSGIFRMFGVYSDLSAFVVLALNSLFSAFTCLAIVWIGRVTFGENVGVLAAWFWALWPMAFWEVRRVWETSLSAFLFSLTFFSIMKLETDGDYLSPLYGLLWGITALTNPSILGFLLPILVYKWVANRPAAPGFRRHLVLASAIALLTITPWIIRDQLKLHRWMVIRDNFGFEMYLGNHPMEANENRFLVHFCNNATEGAKFQSMGEIAYVDEKKKEAFGYISQNRLAFIRHVFHNVLGLWTGTRETWLDVNVSPASQKVMGTLIGISKHVLFSLSSATALCGLFLAFRRKMPQAMTFLIATTGPTLPYYLSHAENRYRHPIEPMLMVLSAFSVLVLVHFFRQRSYPDI